MRVMLEECPGTSIEDACEAAIRIANTLQVGVTFDFNGVPMFASPTKQTQTDARKMVEEYHRLIPTFSKLGR